MVAVLALAGGACGGDDDGDAADDASDTSDTSDTSDVAGNDEEDADSSGDDGSDSGTNEWCTLMESADTPELDSLDITDPDSVENAFQEVVNLMDDAADSAPDEIEDDVQILVDQFKSFFDELEDADFNFSELDQAALENPEADAASARIDEFCGFDDTDDTDTATTDDSDTATTEDAADVPSGDGAVEAELMRQFTAMGMSEDQAGCMVENLDMDEVVANGATDPMMFLDLFETCDINMAELQPPGG